MVSIRDKLFGDLFKGVVKWEFPTISISYLTNMGFAGAITAFAVTIGAAAAPHVVDYLSSRRAAVRKHAVCYFVGLSKR